MLGEYIEIVLKYIYEAESHDRAKLLELMADTLPNSQEKIMSIAEQFKREGKREGMFEMAKALLANGVDKNTVIQVTKLSEKQLATLAANSDK